MQAERSKADDRLTVPEAAAMMGVHPQFLRLGLQRDKFPFGVAIKGARRWSYYINRERFTRYMGGKDLGT